MMRTSFECVLRFCFTLDVINHMLLRESADVSGKTELKVTVNGHLNGVNGHSVEVEGTA